MTSQDGPEDVLKMVYLICEEVVDSGPQRQRRARGSDDWFRDVEVCAFKCHGSKPEHASSTTLNH
jgi:hypothetical protein